MRPESGSWLLCVKVLKKKNVKILNGLHLIILNLKIFFLEIATA